MEWHPAPLDEQGDETLQEPEAVGGGDAFKVGDGGRVAIGVDGELGYTGMDAETRAVWDSPTFQEILARSRRDTTEGREQPAEEVFRELGITPRTPTT